MTAKNLFVVSLTIDASTEDSFGMKIVKIDGMPAAYEFPRKSQMAQYSTINIKSKKVAAEKPAPVAKNAKPAPAPVAVVNEADVQTILGTPGIADMLKQLLMAQGGAAVSQQTLPPVEAPSLKAARGRKPNAK